MRRINTQGVVDRLKMQMKIHQLSRIAILEPFQIVSMFRSFKHSKQWRMLLAIAMEKYGYFVMLKSTVQSLMKMSNKLLVTLVTMSYKHNSLPPMSMKNVKIISEDLSGIKFINKKMGAINYGAL